MDRDHATIRYSLLDWRRSVLGHGRDHVQKSGDTLSPTALNLFKGVVTLMLLLPTLWLADVSLFPPHPATHWLRFGLSGLLGITLADNFFFMALKRLGAGLWAVVDCLYLPMVIVFSGIFLGESIGVKGMLGAACVVIAIMAGSYSGISLNRERRDLVIGLCFGLAAVGFLVISIIMVKPLLEDTSVLWASFVRILAGVSGLLIIAGFHPERATVMAVFKPSAVWKTALPAAIVGNYLAMLAWLAALSLPSSPWPPS